MPEFIAQYTPSRASSTVQGFMDAAEWLLPEEDAAKRIRGWSRAAVRTATRICEAFERDNAAADLARHAVSEQTIMNAIGEVPVGDMQDGEG